MRRADDNKRHVLDFYARFAEGMRRRLELADIAAEHGNTDRMAEHVLDALRDPEPELRVLHAERA